MRPPVTALCAVVSLSLVASIGDFLIKTASIRFRPFHQWQFFVGASLYFLSAVGWVFVMRHLKLGVIGAVFSVSTIASLVLIGFLCFGESLRVKEVVGLGLAIAAILLLSRPA